MARGMLTVARVMLLGMLALAVAGCASGKMKRENEDLKGRVMQLSESLASAEAEASQLVDANAALQSELARTRSDYAAKNAELEALSRQLASQGFDVSVRNGMIVVTMPQQVLYSSGSAAITANGRSRLQTLSQALNGDFKAYSIEIQGHTDNDPIRLTKDKYKSNWELSYERAQNVAYYLIESGKVDPKRLHVAAYGEYKPVAANSSAAGKARNRRVEILVVRPAGS